MIFSMTSNNEDERADLFNRNPLFMLVYDPRIDLTDFGDNSLQSVPKDESPVTDVIIKGDEMTISGNDKALIEFLKKNGVTPKKVKVHHCG
jgi:hypothetical protein